MEATLVIWEPAGEWTAAWRRELARIDARKAPVALDRASNGVREPARGYRIAEVRTPDEARRMMTQAERGACVVAAALTAGARRSVLDLLADLGQTVPDCPLVVLAARDMMHYADLARELGAACVVGSPRQLAPVAASVERYFERFEPAASVAALIPRELLEQLPWGEDRGQQ